MLFTRNRWRRPLLFFLAGPFLLSGCGFIEIVPKPAPEPTAPPEITNVLRQLVEANEAAPIRGDFFPSDSLGAILTLATPAGYRLQLRFNELGVSLIEALKASRDRELIRRIFELAQWGQRPEVRAQALITIAKFSDAGDVGYFDAMLQERDPAMRFAALEALQAWGQDEAKPRLRQVLAARWDPFLQVYAAQALLSLGETDVLPELYEGLDNRSWVVRASAARYLGDYGKPDDYKRLLTALNLESNNDIVAAEMCVSILKLLARTNDKVSFDPARPAWGNSGDVAYTVGADDVVELEPLVIVPPRLAIPESIRVAETINNKLLFILKNINLFKPPTTLPDDPAFQALDAGLTPEAAALETRYSSVNIALCEALAGTRDLLLRSELVRLAEKSPDPNVRSTALLSLSYARMQEDVVYVAQALNSTESSERFGAMESAVAGRFDRVTPELLTIATNDPIPAFRAYATGILLSWENPAAKNTLLGLARDPDWPTRALAVQFLGRYGERIDHVDLLARSATEKNPFVLAEMALAVQRLAPIE